MLMRRKIAASAIILGVVGGIIGGIIIVENNQSEHIPTVATNNLIDSDGDGYADIEDLNPNHWDVGDRDLLMFATLAYEPVNSEVDRISGDTVTGNGKTVAQNYYDRNPNGKITDDDNDGYMEYFNYVCPDAVRFDGELGKNDCMIKEDQMIGMQDQSYNSSDALSLVFQKLISSWKTIGKDYYFGGISEQGDKIQYAKVDEVNQWVIVDHESKNASLNKVQGYFEATTFRLDNNIVIAYRGTDFPDLIEWLQDFSYATGDMFGSYEDDAQRYAKKTIAHFTEEYHNNKDKWDRDYGGEPNFYITGHSLGGYLAQVGALGVINDKPYGYQYLRDVVYFNGMGITFSGGEDDKGIQALKTWSQEKDNNGRPHKLVCYHNNGDLISALGTHVDMNGFYADSGAIIRHSKDTDFLLVRSARTILGKAGINNLTESALSFLNKIAKSSRLSQVSEYYHYYDGIYGNYFKNYFGKYGTLSIADLLWFCHEPSASLFHAISQGSLRGNPEEAVIKQQLSSDGKTVTAVAEINADVTSYKWLATKNGKTIKESEDPTFENLPNDPKIQISLEATINSRRTNNPANRTATLSASTKIDAKSPTITIKSKNNKWRAKKGNSISFTVTASDDNGISYANLSSKDIYVSGIGKNNVNIEVVSGPKFSKDKKSVSWDVKITSSKIGAMIFKIAGGIVVDINGNINGESKSQNITFGLL